MTGRDFFTNITNGKQDIVSLLLALLDEIGCAYCVIGGLGVNAYAEPVVSLDLDLVVVSDRITNVLAAARSRGMTIERFEHSINLSLSGSDLRIQLQTDPRYQDFLFRSETKDVLGYRMSVASLQDILQGKVWAYTDKTRRRSKRQKDLSDIMRLVETYPGLIDNLPRDIQSLLD